MKNRSKYILMYVKNVFLKLTPQDFIKRHPWVIWVSYFILIINFLFPGIRSSIEDFVWYDYELTYITPYQNKSLPPYNLAFSLLNTGSEPIRILEIIIITESVGFYNTDGSKRIDTSKYESKSIIEPLEQYDVSNDIKLGCWFPYDTNDESFISLVKEHRPVCEILVNVHIKLRINNEMEEIKFDYTNLKFYEKCDSSPDIHLIANSKFKLYD